jgi:adenylate cyclase
MPEEQKATRKLRAILSADVKGYSILMSNDETFTIQTLKSYRNIMSEKIQQQGGRVVDSPGDNLLAEFGSAVDAVQCAVEIQKQLKIENDRFAKDKRLQFRIGVNIGDVVQDGNRIYGTGVNIAARIEGIADPSGVCISRNTYDQVKDKIELEFKYLGEHEVKNIKEKIRVYKVLLDSDIPEVMVDETLEPADKPSIAVLPFDNMSRDPEQEYLVDGITENIIAVLSAIPAMFVIARNSTFTYKGKAVNVQKIAQDLNVQYVLEGSVQKSGNRVRVTAQLIDAIKGHHLWAERYDRELHDIFVLQDEITLKILTALQVKLTHGQEAYMHNTTDNLEAWACFVRAIDFFERFTKEDNTKAQDLFEQAVDLDPEYAAALTLLGWTHWIDASYGFSQSRIESFRQAVELAEKALKLDDSNPDVHSLLGGIHLFQGQHELAVSEGKRSIALRPNDACNIALLAQTLSYAGRSEEAIKLMKRAMQLNPYYPGWYLGILAQSYNVAGQHEDAIVTYTKLLEHQRKNGVSSFLTNLGLVLAYMHSGKEKEARDQAKEILRIEPHFSLEWVRQATFFKDQNYLEENLEALRRAGLK